MSDFYRHAATPHFALIGFILALSANTASAQTQHGGLSPPVPSAGETTGPLSLPDVAAIAERSLGQAEAPVRIDVYSSFVCANCAAWYLQVLPQLKAEQLATGRARLVYHDVVVEPVYHSARSAMVGLCTPPSRFFDVAQSFMSGLEEGAKAPENAAGWYARAIAASGREAAEMEACSVSEPVYNQLQVENADPFVTTIKQLPAFTVNGQAVQDGSFNGLSQAINAALPPSESAAESPPPAGS